MDPADLEALLAEVSEGRVTVEEALARLRHLPVRHLAHTRLDTHRALRCGHPEVVYGAGKTPSELVEIARAALEHQRGLLVTRTSAEGAAALLEALPQARHHERCGAVTVDPDPPRPPRGRVLVLSAGTSDRPVAEEAAVTVRAMGSEVGELVDVGIAGLHRLLEHVEELGRADAIVVAAGMEGALPSVVGGLTDRPVIAVPTSVGYGASFAGIAALLGMLNSCAAGVTVVNIDNGFGAGFAAARIARQAARQDA